jgi:hypothetical protein
MSVRGGSCFGPKIAHGIGSSKPHNPSSHPMSGFYGCRRVAVQTANDRPSTSAGSVNVALPAEHSRSVLSKTERREPRHCESILRCA